MVDQTDARTDGTTRDQRRKSAKEAVIAAGNETKEGGTCLRMVAVDLTPLRPGGENGGLKPALFGLLRAAREESNGKIGFIFLVNSTTRQEVRALAHPQDLLICVIGDAKEPAHELSKPPLEFNLLSPPAGFLGLIGVDLLYCPFGAATFHCPNIPTVALIADLLHRDFAAGLSESEREHREQYIQHTLEVATAVQCISRSGMERILEHYQVPREKLFWTYLPIQGRLEVAAGVDQELPTTRPYFFYPANLWPHKNHELLLRSYAKYSEEAKMAAWDLILTFHEDSGAAALKSLAKTLGVAAKVHFAGFVSDGMLHDIWQRSGALVFPSLHEGFGIPLLEAMHYGVPIITGTDFALGEVVGDAGCLIDSRSEASLTRAFLQVSGDPELRHDLIKRGRERLQLFDRARAARMLVAFFDALTQTDDEYPRQSRPLHAQGLLSLATPASRRRWKIELSFKPNASARKIFVYLDNVLFANWSRFSPDGNVFAFFCQPEGRLLQLQLLGDGPRNVRAVDSRREIEAVVATSESGGRILLYGKSPTPSAR